MSGAGKYCPNSYLLTVKTNSNTLITIESTFNSGICSASFTVGKESHLIEVKWFSLINHFEHTDIGQS